MSSTPNEYRPEGSPLTKAGVRCFNAPGASTEFAEYGNLSNAVTVPASATIVHITGQLGVDETGMPIRDVRQQLRAAFLSVERNLKTAGAKDGWKNVYKCVAYHSPDLNEERLAIYAELIKEFCGTNKPSQTSVSVPTLWQGAHIELTVEAVIPADG